MRTSNHLRLLAAVALTALLGGTSTARAAEPSLAGYWQGKLAVGGIELRVVFHITQSKDGALKATLDSPDQGAKNIPLDSISREKATVKMADKRLMAKFEGKLSDDGRTIDGQWTQGGTELPLLLARLDKAPEFGRSQDPKKPYPYAEEEVTIENAKAKVKLAGTLTLPKSAKPVPAVVLISGSGPQDRDESLLGHRPFLVLSDYLTRRGIAVLRCDDRGVGGSTGDPSAATTDDFAGDALAAVAFLKSRPEIDGARIGLVGHSEGGMIAPLAAVRSADVKFIVLMAGTGVTGEQILYRQTELIAKAQGVDDATIAKTRAGQERIFKEVIKAPDLAKVEHVINEILTETTTDSPESIKKQAEAQAKSVIGPWFRYFLIYDPTTALRQVRCPVLAINGQLDLQVDPKQNLPPIEAALKAAGNQDVTVRELPELNHLFQHSKTGSPAEYSRIEETFAPEALEIIGDWIVKRTK